MEKIRKVAPALSVRQPHVDDRLRIETEYDAKFPEFKHVWKDARMSADSLKNVPAEYVMVGGERVVIGELALCRIPKKIWLDRRTAPERASLERIRQIRNEDGTMFIEDPLTVRRNPKILQPEAE